MKKILYVYGVRYLCKMTNVAKQIMEKRCIHPNFSKTLFLVPQYVIQNLSEQYGRAVEEEKQNSIPGFIKKELFYIYKTKKEDLYITQLKKGLSPPEPFYSGIQEFHLFNPCEVSEINDLRWIILSNAIVPLFQEIVVVDYIIGYPYDQMVFTIHIKC